MSGHVVCLLVNPDALGPSSAPCHIPLPVSGVVMASHKSRSPSSEDVPGEAQSIFTD